jgi:hypothetical protein
MEHNKKSITHNLIFFMLLCCFAVLGNNSAVAAPKYQKMQLVVPKTFKAYTDRTEIPEGDTFNLKLKYTGRQTSDTPDITPLNKDFEIYDTGQSFSHSNINGKTETSQEWRFTLMPKHVGAITVPSIKMGKLRTEAFTLNVVDAQNAKEGNAPEVFITASIDKTSPYVQEEVLLTVEIYHRKYLYNASLSPIEVPEISAKKIDRDVSSRKLYKKHYYDVIERKYALFPQSSGDIEIPGIVLKGELVGDSIRKPSINNIFHTRFAENRPVRRQTKPITLNVKPRPDNYTGQRWLPAKELSLFEQLSPENLDNIKAGDAIKRTVIINAKGLLSEQLPDLTMNDIEGIKQYPGQSFTQDLEGENRSGKQSVKQQEFVLIPTNAGTYTLPKIEVTWWNLKTEKEEKATIPAKTINVAAAENGNGDTNATESPATVAEPIKQPLTTPTSTELTKNAPEADIIIDDIPRKMPASWKSLIIIMAIIIAALIAFIAFLLLKRKKASSSNDEEAKHSSWFSSVSKDLHDACTADDANAIKEIIIKWGEKEFSEASKGQIISLNFISKHAASEEFKEELEKLQKCIYGADTSAKDLDIENAFKQEIAAQKERKKSEQKQNKKNKGKVPDLYPPR